MPSTTRTSATLRASTRQRRAPVPPVDSRSAPTTLRPVFLNNDEAAQILNLSPRTLEKHRVIGGGPRFRKFGRRVVYALADLETWANARACESTSDPRYVARR
jgi:hypothetical protein